MDEPINGLDPTGIQEIRNYLLQLCKEKGTTILVASHVLSEIEQMADMIGVMHEGRLLEEIDRNRLHMQNQKYVEFEVSDINAAILVLEREFHMFHYTAAGEKKLRIFGAINRRAEINRSFLENGVIVTKINVYEEKLEDYFEKLIGGGKIE